MAVAAAAAVLAGLGGCASAPPGTGPRSEGVPRLPAAGRDGVETSPPPGLAATPDAEPRIEPIRQGGPNKPYEVLGQTYAPVPRDEAIVERGLASWYGRKFHGRRTASGEIYDMYGMTAAHKTMPLPSFARVSNPANGREIIVRVNDRGPFSSGRVIDLSYTAALKLGLLRGVAPVEVERLTHEAIRTGSWRRAAPDTDFAAVTVPQRPQPSAASVAAREPVSAVAEPLAQTLPPQDMTLAAVPTQAPPSVITAVSAAPDPQPERATALVPGARGFWVQLGAFRQRDGAQRLHRQVLTELDWLAPWTALFEERAVHRVQAGPYTTHDEAKAISERVREAFQVIPLIVERR